MTAVARPRNVARSRGALPTVALAILLLAWLTAGCSHYSFSSTGRGGGKGGLSTIAVPLLTNETLEYGAEQDLTDALIAEFTEDSALRVVGEEDAESILRGAVVLYQRPVMSYDSSGNPREYKVRVVAKLSYENLTDNSVVWDEEIEGWAVYSVDAKGGELTSEEEARAYAFEKLAQDVLSKTVQGW